jgi:hypothetical protein
MASGRSGLSTPQPNALKIEINPFAGIKVESVKPEERD